MRAIYLSLCLCLAAGMASAAPTAQTPPASRVRQMIVSVVVQPDGRYVETMHAEMQATNDAAAMKMGQAALPYDAAMQSLDIVEAHTLKKDGKTVPVDASAIYDQLAPGAESMPMYTQFHNKTIVFPQFAAGDTAVYTIKLTTKTAVLPGTFWYGGYYSPQIAYDEVRETVTAPASMALKVESHDVAFSKRRDGDNIVYSWHYSAPDPSPPDKQAVAQLSRVPHFYVSTFADYRALAKRYADAAEPEEDVTPAIQSRADQITAGVTDRRQQVRKLYDWVSSHIRYVAVEIGRGSMVPHSAQSVLTNGYGDCKDHVVLLATLLKAKGIKSEGVLINAGNDYELTDVPTFAGLDHIITYVPEFDLYLDSTAVVAPFGVLPFNEYGKPVVFASTSDPRRGTVPPLVSGAATSYTKTLARLTKDGHWTGTTVTSGTGPYVFELREFGLAALAVGPDVLASRLMNSPSYGHHPKGAVTAPPPLQPSDHYAVTAQFDADNWQEEADGKRALDMPGGLRVLGASGNGPMGALFDSSRLADDADYPCYSVANSEDISLTAPDGMAFDRVPANVHVTSPNIRFDAQWTLKGNTLSVHRDFTSHIDGALCTADIRAANKTALKEISDSYDTHFSLDPASGSVAAAASSDTTARASTTGPQTAAPVTRLQEVPITVADSGLDALMAQAQRALLAGEMDKALPLLTTILARPDLPEQAAYVARSNRATLYYRTGHFTEALADAQAGLAKAPSDSRLLTIRADAELHLDDRDKAMADYNAAIKANPKNDYALFRRGDLLFREGRYREALDDYTALHAAGAKEAVGLYVLRAVAEQRLGLTKAMRADLDRAEDISGPKARNDFTTISDQTISPPKPPMVPPETSSDAIPKSDAKGLTPPAPLSYHAAIGYPPLSRYMADEGSVLVSFTVGKDGHVHDPKIAKSSGFEDMDQMALDSVHSWLYRPAEKDGTPIEVRTKARLAFALNDNPAKPGDKP